jgi:hypothetical protein
LQNLKNRAGVTPSTAVMLSAQAMRRCVWRFTQIGHVHLDCAAAAPYYRPLPLCLGAPLIARPAALHQHG